METIFDFGMKTSHAALQWGLTSLWFGLLLAALTAIILRRAKNTHAATRYGIWWLSLIAVVMLPFLHAVYEKEAVLISAHESEGLSSSPGMTDPAPAAFPVIPETGPSLKAVNEGEMQAGAPASSMITSLLPSIIFFIWCLITAFLLVKLLCIYLRINRIKHRSQHFLHPYEFPFQHRAKLRLSDEIDYPMAAGLGNPKILLPRKMADKLTPDEMEAVILHEAMHLARKDDWARLAQKIVQAVLFFHPAIHWIGRHLDLERELACDDRVLERTREPKEYCRCLARLMELTPKSRNVLAPAAVPKRKQIFTRFERILRTRPGHSTRFSRGRFAAVSGTLAILSLLSMLAVPAVAIPFPSVTLDELKAGFSPDEDQKESASEDEDKIFIPPELKDRIDALPEGKIVDWSLKIYSLPISFTLKSSDDKEEVATLWINKENNLRAVMRGSVRFTNDDQRVAWISSPGFLAVMDERGADRMELEVRPGPTVAFYMNGEPIRVDERANAWMKDVLLYLIRKAGVGARERAARITERGGAGGLIAEVLMIKNPWVQEEYLLELIRFEDRLDTDHLKRTLEVIKKLPVINRVKPLIELFPQCRQDENIKSLHEKAVSGIESSYERNKVIEAISGK